jgi:hypothetical protein
MIDGSATVVIRAGAGSEQVVLAPPVALRRERKTRGRADRTQHCDMPCHMRRDMQASDAVLTEGNRRTAKVPRTYGNVQSGR